MDAEKWKYMDFKVAAAPASSNCTQIDTHASIHYIKLLAWTRAPHFHHSRVSLPRFVCVYLKIENCFIFFYLCVSSSSPLRPSPPIFLHLCASAVIYRLSVFVCRVLYCVWSAVSLVTPTMLWLNVTDVRNSIHSIMRIWFMNWNFIVAHVHKSYNSFTHRHTWPNDVKRKYGK